MERETTQGTEGAQAALESYKQLARELRAEGFYELTPWRVLGELLLHLVVCLGGLAVGVLAGPWWVKGVGFLVSTLGALGIATNTHTSSHDASGRSRRLNRFLTYLGYPFFFGMSATYWWHKHCVVHHPNPNLIGVDDDADLMPWFAINEDDYAAARGWRKLLFRVQWLVIPFALALNEFNIQLSGWRYLVPILADPERRRTAHWIDLGVLGLHWSVWVILPMFFFPPLEVLAVYGLRMGLMGYAMFVAFAPAHFPEEAAFAAGTERKTRDFVLRQTVTTVNFRTGPVGRLLCSGVEYQIEHHLFPGISHAHYPALAPRVEAFCRRHGYPYRTLGWGEATWKSLLIFRYPKRVAAELDAERRALAGAP